MLKAIKSTIPKSWRKAVWKHVLHPWQRFRVLLPNIVSTEYNYRFRRGMIQDELNQSRHLPRNLHIEGTNICNAECVFCAYPQMERVKETMSMEDFRRIVDEYVALGGHYVSMTPIVGDPFVDRHLFERLDDLDRRPEIDGFDFYTNGILLKPQVSERLLKYGNKLKMHISFGGFDRETYKAIMGVDHFDLVRRNIEALVEAKRNSGSATHVTLALRCPPEKWVGPFWEKCVAYEQAGLMETHFIWSFDSWAGKVKAAALEEVGLIPTTPPYKRGACELLYMKPIVLANGKVNACACRDVEAELIIGDLNESSLAEIWNSPALEELIQRHERGDFPDVCQRCTWYNSVYNLHNRYLHLNKRALTANQSSP